MSKILIGKDISSSNRLAYIDVVITNGNAVDISDIFGVTSYKVSYLNNYYRIVVPVYSGNGENRRGITFKLRNGRRCTSFSLSEDSDFTYDNTSENLEEHTFNIRISGLPSSYLPTIPEGGVNPAPIGTIYLGIERYSDEEPEFEIDQFDPTNLVINNFDELLENNLITVQVSSEDSGLLEVF